MPLRLALRAFALLVLGSAALLASEHTASAQAVIGTCASCSAGATDPNCGACIASGTECFNALMPADRRLGVFQTSDGMDARSLTFGRLVRGASTSAADINRAVSRTYAGGTAWLYYGSGAPAGYCAPAGGPPRAFATDPEYVFGWNHAFEDALNGLDCYNAEIDRFYLGAAGHADGDRVCDGEQGFFDPANGAIFDLGGEGNRVVVFPFTDHGPLPCESWEYSVWLSDDPMATEVADPSAPDPRKWNPALLTTVFLQGWIPDEPTPATEADALAPDLSNATMRDGIVQVFALPCGLTFRYASLVGGNNGNPTDACQFWSFDAELDAVAGLNEDNTAICPDADGDGFRDVACGGTDCDDADPARHPGAFERCDATEDLDCLPMADCPPGTACAPDSGLCVSQCFEGGCGPGFTCVDGTYCVDTACAGRTAPCPDGTLCREGECVGPCDGVVCPRGQRCLSGACLDPCLGVDCPVNQVCVAADPDALTLCGPSCACADLAASICADTEACDARMDSPTEGMCVDAGCETATCTAAEVCTGGTCEDGCTGVVCPRAQACVDGECVPDLCAAVSCGPGLACQGGECVDACTGVTCGEGLVCRAGDCVPDPCAGVDCGPGARCSAGSCVSIGTTDGGSGLDGATGADTGTGGADDDGGCGCRIAAPRHSTRGLLAVLLVGLAVAFRRRRRR